MVKQRHYRSIWGLAGGIGLLAAAGVIVWKVEPVWWTEILFVSLVWLGNLILWRFVTNTRKWGWVIATGICGLLILNRLGWLDPVTLGLVLVFLGLISLIN